MANPRGKSDQCTPHSHPVARCRVRHSGTPTYPHTQNTDTHGTMETDHYHEEANKITRTTRVAFGWLFVSGSWVAAEVTTGDGGEPSASVSLLGPDPDTAIHRTWAPALQATTLTVSWSGFSHCSWSCRPQVSDSRVLSQESWLSGHSVSSNQQDSGLRRIYGPRSGAWEPDSHMGHDDWCTSVDLGIINSKISQRRNSFCVAF